MLYLPCNHVVLYVHFTIYNQWLSDVKWEEGGGGGSKNVYFI